MADRPAAYSSFASNILRGATWTGTPPINSTYGLDVLQHFRSEYRIKFGASTAEVIATLSSPQEAEVMAMAGSNADPGGSTLRLKNDAGLNIVIPVQDLPSDEITLSPILDLREFVSAGVRTSDEWRWVCSGNSNNWTLLAQLWLGTLTPLQYQPGLKIMEEHFADVQENQAGTENITDWNQRKRWLEFQTTSSEAQRDEIVDAIRASHGLVYPSVVWPDTTINDCLIGRWPKQYGNDSPAWGYAPMGLKFTETPKGIPLL